MPITATAFTALSKQARADTGWHTAMNTNLDKLDRFVGVNGFGDPNLDLITVGTLRRQEVTVEFIGQYWYRKDSNTIYRGTTVGVPPAGVWTPEIPRGATMGFLGNAALIAGFKGWVWANGQSVSLMDTFGLIETVVVPNAKGRMLITFDDGLTDPDYDTVAELGAGGPKTFTIKEENIEEFVKTTESQSEGNAKFGGTVGSAPPPPVDVGAGIFTHTHTVRIGKPPGATLIPIDNRPPYIVSGLLYKL